MLSQPPLLETVPVYPSSGLTLEKTSNELPEEYRDLQHFAAGLMRPTDELYRHQRRSLDAVLLEGKDIVVTTATSSGKTECFLLPLLAQLAAESRSWPGSPEPPPDQKWWHGGTREEGKGQSAHTGRAKEGLHAVRAVILYPLNALVEDQLRRLRTTLDSDTFHQWLDRHRPGNRVLFGRYTGLTPVPGRLMRGTARTERMNPTSMRLTGSGSGFPRLKRRAADIIEEVRQGRLEEEVRYYFQNIDGGEMWSRWDMQETPPDILITNYCMLNIMLMRTIEADIFTKTRDWLAGDPYRKGQAKKPTRKFFLIIDELHSYRGTPGTEVAYILRLLLQRIGLSPDSRQLQILSTSASVAGNEQSLAFLRDFFGRRFGLENIVEEQQSLPPAGSRFQLAGNRPAFERFARHLQSDLFNPMQPPDAEATETLEAMARPRRGAWPAPAGQRAR